MMVSVRAPVIGWGRGWTRRTEERGKGNSIVLTNDLLGSARRSLGSWASSTYLSPLALAKALERLTLTDQAQLQAHNEGPVRNHQ